VDDRKLLEIIKESGKSKSFHPVNETDEEFVVYDKLVEQLLHLESNGLLNKVSIRKNNGLSNRIYLSAISIGGVTHKGIQYLESKDYNWLSSIFLYLSIILGSVCLLYAALWLIEPNGEYEPMFAVPAFLAPLLYALSRKIKT